MLSRSSTLDVCAGGRRLAHSISANPMPSDRIVRAATFPRAATRSLSPVVGSAVPLQHMSWLQESFLHARTNNLDILATGGNLETTTPLDMDGVEAFMNTHYTAQSVADFLPAIGASSTTVEMLATATSTTTTTAATVANAVPLPGSLANWRVKKVTWPPTKLQVLQNQQR